MSLRYKINKLRFAVLSNGFKRADYLRKKNNPSWDR